MSHNVNHTHGHQGDPSKNAGGTDHGPIHSPMADGMVAEEPEGFKSTGGGVYYGLDEPYTKGTPTKLPEISFDTSGSFGKVPKVND